MGIVNNIMFLSVLILLIALSNASAPYLMDDSRRMLANETEIIDESIKGPLDYDQDETLYLLRYALAAYDSIANIENWPSTNKCCKNTNKLLDTKVTVNEQLLAYTGYNTEYDAIFVVLRGTDTRCDWICDDADAAEHDYVIPTTSTKIGKVATGFYESWRENLKTNVASNVTYLISQYFPNITQCKIYVTGHSLGASMSQIAALDFTYEYSDCTIMNINFGSPRWGDKDLIDVYQKRMGNNSIRVVNRKDIVPLFYPTTFFDYIHTPLFIHYDNPETGGNLNYELCKRDEKDNNCYYNILKSCPYDHTHYLQLEDATCEGNVSYGCWDGDWNDYLDTDDDGNDELSTDDNDTTVATQYSVQGFGYKQFCQRIMGCGDDADGSVMAMVSCFVVIMTMFSIVFGV